MVNYQYTYLLGSSLSFFIWLILFFYRKDLRKEMIFMSILMGILGFFSELIYTLDWWHPITITNTIIGFEDFIFGFSVGGISAVIYEEVFKKRITIRKDKKREASKNHHLFLFACSIILFLFSFFILRLNSFYSSTISLLIPTLFIWIKRKDLIYDSLASGFLVLLIAFIGINIIELITPGWVNSAWYLDNLSGIIIFKLPLEDAIWFFLSGAFVGPLYAFWKEGRIIDSKN